MGSKMSKLKKLNGEQRKSLAEQYNIIAECNTSELLEYSKDVYKLKNKFSKVVMDALFEAIDMRRTHLNSNLDERVACENKKAINAFIVKGRVK